MSKWTCSSRVRELTALAPVALALALTAAGCGEEQSSASVYDCIVQATARDVAAFVVDEYEQGTLGTRAQVAKDIRALRGADTPGFTPTSFLDGEGIVPYDEMTYAQRSTFTYWYQSNPRVQDAVGDDVRQARIDARREAERDCAA
jgi:hypothetical protein